MRGLQYPLQPGTELFQCFLRFPCNIVEVDQPVRALLDQFEDFLFLLGRHAEMGKGSPGGHFKFLHLWPGQIPPVEDDRTGEFYSLAEPFARREAASLSR